MINKKLGLKVKVKHLAEESRIIRFEEYKHRDESRDWLHSHRIQVVRPEARATNIAYAFAKGVPLKKIEKYPQDIPSSIWARVAIMVRKYSGKPMSEYKEWIGSSIG